MNHHINITSRIFRNNYHFGKDKYSFLKLKLDTIYH